MHHETPKPSCHFVPYRFCLDHIASLSFQKKLTHWGRVSNIAIIGSDNGLSPERHQAIIWTNAGMLLIEPLATNFSEIFIEIYTFSLKKMHLKMSGKWRPSCLGLDVEDRGDGCTWISPFHSFIAFGFIHRHSSYNTQHCYYAYCYYYHNHFRQISYCYQYCYRYYCLWSLSLLSP